MPETSETPILQIRNQIQQLKANNSDLKSRIEALKTRTDIIDKNFVMKLENDIVVHFRNEKDVKDLINLKASLGELYESDLTSRYNELLKRREDIYLRILQIPTNEFYYEYLDVLFMKEKKCINQIKLIENKPRPPTIITQIDERLVKTDKIKQGPKGQFFILPEFFKKNNLSGLHKSVKAINVARNPISNLEIHKTGEGRLIGALKENKSVKFGNNNNSKNQENKAVKKVTFKITKTSETKLSVANWRKKSDKEDVMVRIRSNRVIYKRSVGGNDRYSYGKSGGSRKLMAF